MAVARPPVQFMAACLPALLKALLRAKGHPSDIGVAELGRAQLPPSLAKLDNLDLVSCPAIQANKLLASRPACARVYSRLSTAKWHSPLVAM